MKYLKILTLLTICFLNKQTYAAYSADLSDELDPISLPMQTIPSIIPSITWGTTACVSGILSLIGASILTRYKDQREPKKYVAETVLIALTVFLGTKAWQAIKERSIALKREKNS